VRNGKGPSDFIRYSHLGVQFALIVLLSIYGGIWLDRKLSTGNWLTLVGTFVGAGVGFYVLWRETQSADRSDPEDPDRSHPGARGRGGDSDGEDRRE
jgi:hypothetical protein